MIKSGMSPKRLKVKQKITKVQPDKLLNKEVNRMEQKLQILKEQLKKKKQQKQKQTHINYKTHNFLSQGTTPLSVSRSSDQFEKLLESLKMEKHKTTLASYGVTSQDQLFSLSSTQIDEMGNIPIGFRIKIKKLIQKHQQQKNEPEEQKNQNQVKQDENIEEILQRRKKQRKFIPLEKQVQEEGQVKDHSIEYIEEKDEEQINVQSLLNMLSKNRQQNADTVKRAKEQRREVENQRKYCWMCLSLSQNPIEEYKRVYCRIECLKNYENKIKVDEKMFTQNQQFQQIEKSKKEGKKVELEQDSYVDLSIL